MFGTRRRQVREFLRESFCAKVSAHSRLADIGATGNEPRHQNNIRMTSSLRRTIVTAVVFLTITLVATILAENGLTPDRTVNGSTIVSSHDPAIRIELPPSAHYIGADRWPLYDIADCELHAFVEADNDKNIHRLYWVQFEAYLPSKPDLHHTYDSPRHATIAGLDFYVDTSVVDSADESRKGSDREHIHALIHSRGYKLPVSMMSVRLVHLLDQEKRKELMIIYSEELPNKEWRAADLKPGGKVHDQWVGLEAGLIERANSQIKLEPRAEH